MGRLLFFNVQFNFNNHQYEGTVTDLLVKNEAVRRYHVVFTAPAPPTDGNSEMILERLQLQQGVQWNMLNLHLLNDLVFIQVLSDTIESHITNESRRAAV